MRQKFRFWPLIISFVCIAVFGTYAQAEGVSSTQQGSLWGNANTNTQISGYGFVGYEQLTDDNSSGAFSLGFNPIFHYTYKDIAMFEGELEFEVDEKGDTKTTLEYAVVDLFLNDYMILVAGRFISPVGFFVQNIHAAWINKLPGKPVGFGHDGAAPSSETGVQLRGGIPLGNMRLNYAFYIGNGPTLQKEGISSTEDEPELLMEGVGQSDLDGSKSGGGRIGFLPVQELEIGFSYAAGRVKLVKDGAASGPKRNLRIVGGDINYVSSILTGLRVRGEFIRTTVSGIADTYDIPGKIEMTAWYGEISYKTEWGIEPVVRYSSFDSEKDVKEIGSGIVSLEEVETAQLAIGINYYFEPNIIAKIAYENEKTKRESGTTKENKVLVQLAYGF